MEQYEIAWRSPLVAFAPLAGCDGAILLHGGDAAIDTRWSFIAASPRNLVTGVDGKTFVDGALSPVSPFDALSRLHRERRRLSVPDRGPPLISGLIGFCGYECGRFCEPGAQGPASPYDMPDFSFGAYDAIAAFDRRARKTYLLGREAEAIDALSSMLGTADLAPPPALHLDPPESNFSRDAYCKAVSALIEKIANGDLFQANISQRFEACAAETIDSFAFFRAVSRDSSSGFGAFFTINGVSVISQSPERFFAVKQDAQRRFKITAEPIKGTRPRGATLQDDLRLRAELLADPKDRAENIMIADLTRNDLSRICDDFTIREDAVCEAVSYANVHHMVSRISGRLRADINAADALCALFPCGSITGAPKVEAMKAIAAIERAGRGPYCGAIGYIDDRGGADISVAIRIAVAVGRRLLVPVGGGITLRSDPEAEYEETLAKARQFLHLAGEKGRTAT